MRAHGGPKVVEDELRGDSALGGKVNVRGFDEWARSRGKEGGLRSGSTFPAMMGIRLSL